jgi:hypothetical protein
MYLDFFDTLSLQFEGQAQFGHSRNLFGGGYCAAGATLG